MRSLSEEQRLGFAHLTEHERSNLFMPPGMGKTGVVLHTLADTVSWPVLVVAPLRVCQEVWPVEPDEWDATRGLRVSVICGNPQKRLEALRRPAEVYTINPENLPWLEEQRLPRFRAVIVDECAMLRGLRLQQGTRNSAALLRIAQTTKRYHGLTGSPTTNGLQSLWGITYPVDAGVRLGTSYSAFELRWFERNVYTMRLDPFPHSFEQITGAIRDVSPSILPRTKPDAPVEIEVPVRLGTEAQALYDEMAETMTLADYDIEALDGASKAGKLLQIGAGAAYRRDGDAVRFHDAKLDALERVVSEHAAPMLVSYRFTFERDRILKRFPKARALGPGVVDEWNKGNVPMLVMHARSGGHGLNLQHGGYAITHTTLPHDLELFEQINARIGPQRQRASGYAREVFHYYLMATPIDRMVLRTLREKCTLQDAFLYAMMRS